VQESCSRSVQLASVLHWKKGKQMYIRAEIWPATISHRTSTGLGWPPSDWLSPRPCDTVLAGCSLATDTVDVLLGWRLSLVQNGSWCRGNSGRI
ncbi:hypothetical protein IRJ41_025069, partial [Triplophysa rosa]